MIEMESDYYSLSWDNFRNTLSSGFNSLLKDGNFVDVTLAVEGKFIKAHKTVLSVCSSFFKELFKANPCQHPIVILPNVNYNNLCDLLTFMYQGEVSVSQDEISSFIKVAEMLKIKGLTDNNCKNPALIPESNSNPKQSQKSDPEKTNNDNKIKLLDIPKVEALDESESNTTFDKFDDNSMDYEEQERTSPDFVDILSLKTEGIIGNISDDELGESSSFQNTETELQTNQTPFDRLTEKSKESYLREYSLYKEWCEKKNIEIITEQAMFEYLDEKSKILKSSSLWNKYSILKTTLAAQENIQIHFPKVAALLKRKAIGYTSNVTRTFTRDDIDKFLTEAPDDVYLMMKVALILGVTGGCRLQELTMMSIDDIQDKGSILIVKLPSEGAKTRRTFVLNQQSTSGIDVIDIYRKYLALRKPGTEHKRLFVNYRFGKCSTQPVGRNTLGTIPRRIAKFLQKSNLAEYTGHCFKRTATKLMITPGMTI